MYLLRLKDLAIVNREVGAPLSFGLARPFHCALHLWPSSFLVFFASYRTLKLPSRERPRYWVEPGPPASLGPRGVNP
jgi:hypothetical protein